MKRALTVFAIQVAVILAVGFIALSLDGCTTPTEPVIPPPLQIVIESDGSWREYTPADDYGYAPVDSTRHVFRPMGAIRDPLRDTTCY